MTAAEVYTIVISLLIVGVTNWYTVQSAAIFIIIGCIILTILMGVIYYGGVHLQAKTEGPIINSSSNAAKGVSSIEIPKEGGETPVDKQEAQNHNPFAPLAKFIIPEEGVSLKMVFDNLRNIAIVVRVMYAWNLATDPQINPWPWIPLANTVFARRFLSGLMGFVSYGLMGLNFFQAVMMGGRAAEQFFNTSIKDHHWTVTMFVSLLELFCALIIVSLGIVLMYVGMYTMQKS